jgi:crossover junction endodeoxyribonuclease RuvC
VVRILGIDPGSRKTGYGVIDVGGDRHHFVAAGVLRVPDVELPERLFFIFTEVAEVVRQFNPTEAAIERVFMNRNADSALKLGQARGVAICAMVSRELSVAEYAAKQVKQAIVGWGGADKAQVQQMIQKVFKLETVPQEDAADALAVALCHSQQRVMRQKLQQMKERISG